jgi:hypothetical protein
MAKTYLPLLLVPLSTISKETPWTSFAERAKGRWAPNPLDLQPGVDPSVLRDVKGVEQTKNEGLDTQPPRKGAYKSSADKGHHPEWMDARRRQQERFWGPYTMTNAASRASNADLNDVLQDSEHAWSQGSVYDPGHPWDTHNDQHWARPQLARLLKHNGYSGSKEKRRTTGKIGHLTLTGTPRYGMQNSNVREAGCYQTVKPARTRKDGR